MKILLASDSHTHDEKLKRLVKIHPNCDVYLHAGDSQSRPEDICPFISVRGNCDYYSSDFPKDLSIKTPAGNLYMEHIPYYYANLSKLKKQGYKIYVCGHTHKKKYEIVDDIHIINPGSLAYSRGDEESYAIIEIEPNMINVKFYNFED